MKSILVSKILLIKNRNFVDHECRVFTSSGEKPHDALPVDPGGEEVSADDKIDAIINLLARGQKRLFLWRSFLIRRQAGSQPTRIHSSNE
jgi:hypothetical protein